MYIENNEEDEEDTTQNNQIIRENTLHNARCCSKYKKLFITLISVNL